MNAKRRNTPKFTLGHLLKYTRVTVSIILFCAMLLMFVTVEGVIARWFGWIPKIQFFPVVLTGCGAAVAIYLNNNVIAIIYGLVLLLTAAMQQRRKSDHEGVIGSETARRLKLYGSWPQKDGTVKHYQLRHVGGGFGVMYVAGVLSGILGIGSGVLKVLAMDAMMKVPFKVSTTTSNFMMGVTACASAVIYVQRGIIEPGIACPVMIGVLFGALTGARLLKRMDVRVLRQIFCVAIVLVAVNMIWQGWAGQY